MNGPRVERGARLSHLFMTVSDLERARGFYVDLLGLEILMDHPGYLRVGGAGGFHIGLEEGEPADIGASGIEIVVQVDDVDARYEAMAQRRVAFSGPPADQEWGARHAWLRDPDGYRLSICSPVGE
jgi:catechol 2,3-dioxygenase-like lactoylglutathione lyase family enzyme